MEEAGRSGPRPRLESSSFLRLQSAQNRRYHTRGIICIGIPRLYIIFKPHGLLAIFTPLLSTHF
jgi:hypothetical protein